jgi:hypothetical protein
MREDDRESIAPEIEFFGIGEQDDGGAACFSFPA